MDVCTHYKPLSILQCAPILAFAAQPHTKQSAPYITLTLRINLNHSQSLSNATNSPLMTNNHKRLVSNPWILKFPSTYSGPDPTMFLHRPYYVSTSSLPATLVNGQTLQTLIKLSVVSHHLCGIS